MQKRVVQALILVSISTLVAIVIVDLGYRWIVEPADVVPRSIGQYDSILGWALKPNATGTSKATGRKVTYHVNSNGLRDRETDYAKPAGVVRIALLGDSRTFGYGVQIEQHFSTLLEGYFKNVEAVNLGVSGYGVDQELLAFRTKGVRYQPDIVIAYVAHFGDQRHMYGDRWGRPKPQFVMKDGVLTLTNVPVPLETAGMDFPHRVDFFFTKHSPLYRDLSHAAITVIKKVLGKSEPPPAAPKTTADSAAFADRMYTLAEAILQQLNQEATAGGARLVIVTELPRLFRECTKLGLTVLDVEAALGNGNYALPKKLAHINEAGNGVLAWEIAQFLKRTGMMPAGHMADSLRVEAPS